MFALGVVKLQPIIFNLFPHRDKFSKVYISPKQRMRRIHVSARACLHL